MQVLTADLRGANCSTSLIMETDDVNYNGTSICSNGSHTGIGTNYGPFTDWVRIVFQRKNCSDDSNFRVRIFSKYAGNIRLNVLMHSVQMQKKTASQFCEFSTT